MGGFCMEQVTITSAIWAACC